MDLDNLGGGMSAVDAMKIRGAIQDSPNIVCKKCGGKIFLEGSVLKNVPGIMLGQLKENNIVPIPVFYCVNCGEIPDEVKAMYDPKVFGDDEPKKEVIIKQ